MKNLLKIFAYTKNLWPYFLAVSLGTIIISLLGISIPLIVKQAVDAITHATATGTFDVSKVIWLAVALLAVDFSMTLLQNITGYLGDVMSEKMRRQLSIRYYEHLLSLSQSYYDQELTGKIINRLNRTISELTGFINAFANNFSSMLLTVVFVIIITFFYSWEVSVLLIVLYPLFMGLTALTSKKWMKWMTKRNEQIDIASGRFAEVVAQMRVVKSFVYEKRELSFFTKRFDKDVSLLGEQSAYWHKMDVARRLVLNIIVFAVFALIFVKTMNRHLTIGEMVLLLQYVTMARQPIFGMSFMVDQTQRAIAGSKDYFEVMATPPAVVDADDATKLVTADGKVEFRNVDFGYDDTRVIHDVSFVARGGEKIALVGESGEGKSTLTSLLLRLYEPSGGEILIDRQNISHVTQTSLRHNVAVVFQEPALFSGTIRENIAYGRPDATDEEVEKAARSANAYEFIKKFEDGFDSEIGERGLKLSGGQKQRIAIARALLKDAPVLILDEATSSLDSKSEKLVQDALDTLMKGRTTVIIAHRLSTIAHVDQIITLKNGRVDEMGTPTQLAKTDGIYAQLLRLQLGQTEADKKKLQKFDIEK